MKKAICLGISFVMLLLVSCQQASAYKQDKLLDYIVSYQEQEFSFPKVPWGASREETIEKLGVEESDFIDMGNDIWRLEKRVEFQEPSCSGFLLFVFQNDALVRVELSISNDFQVEESSQYPKIDMKAVRIGLAEQIESSNLLETSMADGLETLKQGDQTPNLLFGGNSSGYLRIMGADNIDTISISVETKTIQ